MCGDFRICWCWAFRIRLMAIRDGRKGIVSWILNMLVYVNIIRGLYDSLPMGISFLKDPADRHPEEHRPVFAGIPENILHHEAVDTG